MANPGIRSHLAKRYVELWQDYLTAAAADPDLADSLPVLLVGWERGQLRPGRHGIAPPRWREATAPWRPPAPDLHDHAAPQRSRPPGPPPMPGSRPRPLPLHLMSAMTAWLCSRRRLRS